MDASELRPGMTVRIDNQLWSVVSNEHVKPGKGPAYAQLKLKNLDTGAQLEKRLRSEDEVERAFIERRDMEFLYSDAENAVFMDLESFEQVEIPLSTLGERAHFLQPNLQVRCQQHEGRILEVELPTTVEMTVKQTAPQPKGATVTNQNKSATLENDVEVLVPPFVENGEVVKINPETGEYQGRGEKQKK